MGNFRIEILLFAAVWWTSMAFHSGGGWNQNARFAQVRAIVEERTFAIDHFLVYSREAESGGRLKLSRVPIELNGIGAPSVALRGSPREKARLAWRAPDGKLAPIGQAGGLDFLKQNAEPSGERLLPLQAIASSGDVAFARGHFYPNKPPGASLAAVPAYAVLFAVERFLGWTPDQWWIFTVNAWLSTACSVGLASALNAVILFRLSRRVDPAHHSRSALCIALAYAFGTMALPYGTMLFDQAITAMALLGAFALLLIAREKAEQSLSGDQSSGPFPSSLSPFLLVFLAGLCAGGAVVSNYVAGAALVLLALYAGKRHWGAFALGTAAPLAFLAWYHSICFGSPLSLATAFQNPLFQLSAPTPLWMGMFRLPKPEIAVMLLLSPFRGLFVLSPVLALGVWGIWRLRRTRANREAWLCTGVFLLFFSVNVLFSGWHGGYGVAPRYLGPAVPFLALGLVAVWRSHRRLCVTAACLSAGMQFVLTATDPLSPVGTGSIARDGRSDWLYSPLTDYCLPLLVAGRAWPLLDSMSADYLSQQEKALSARGIDPAMHVAEIEWLRRELQHSIERGDVFPLPLAAFSGPVSVNPVGVCEGDFFQLFVPHSLQARWNAFNIGEFFWPESLWSLAPVVAVAGILTAFAGWFARERRSGAESQGGQCLELAGSKNSRSKTAAGVERSEPAGSSGGK